MEDVLDIYKRPYDAKRSVVCMDETNKQLIKETRITIPASPGKSIRYDAVSCFATNRTDSVKRCTSTISI